jgi:hypothetical protein
MFLIDQLAEHHIQQARERGEFDNLPGSGRPLILEDEALVPEELRAGFRLLKNAGFLPPQLQLTREIREVEQLLSCVQDGGERERAERRLSCLRLQLSSYRGDGIDLAVERRYQDKLLQKL